jgi:hypothetical protein
MRAAATETMHVISGAPLQDGEAFRRLPGLSDDCVIVEHVRSSHELIEPPRVIRENGGMSSRRGCRLAVSRRW